MRLIFLPGRVGLSLVPPVAPAVFWRGFFLRVLLVWCFPGTCDTTVGLLPHR